MSSSQSARSELSSRLSRLSERFSIPTLSICPSLSTFGTISDPAVWGLRSEILIFSEPPSASPPACTPSLFTPWWLSVLTAALVLSWTSTEALPCSRMLFFTACSSFVRSSDWSSSLRSSQGHTCRSKDEIRIEIRQKCPCVDHQAMKDAPWHQMYPFPHDPDRTCPSTFTHHTAAKITPTQANWNTHLHFLPIFPLHRHAIPHVTPLSQLLLYHFPMIVRPPRLIRIGEPHLYLGITLFYEILLQKDKRSQGHIFIWRPIPPARFFLTPLDKRTKWPQYDPAAQKFVLKTTAYCFILLSAAKLLLLKATKSVCHRVITYDNSFLWKPHNQYTTVSSPAAIFFLWKPHNQYASVSSPAAYLLPLQAT